MQGGNASLLEVHYQDLPLIALRLIDVGHHTMYVPAGPSHGCVRTYCTRQSFCFDSKLEMDMALVQLSMWSH
jgi:hypothetical protein